MNTVQSYVGKGLYANPNPPMDATASKTPPKPDNRQDHFFVDPQTGQAQESWKPLAGFEKRYQVSNLGRIWDSKQHHYAKTYPSKTGDQCLMVKDLSDTKKLLACIPIHRAVAKAFIPNPHNYEWVKRKVKNGSRNEVTNLYWEASPAQRFLPKVVCSPNTNLPFTESTLDRLLSEGKLTPEQRIQASVIRVLDDSMAPMLSEGSQIIIAPIADSQLQATTGVVAVVLKAPRFYCYLGRVVSVDNESVCVRRDNPQWEERTESRSVIAGLAQVLFVLNNPIR